MFPIARLRFFAKKGQEPRLAGPATASNPKKPARIISGKIHGDLLMVPEPDDIGFAKMRY